MNPDGETDLNRMLQTLTPAHHPGDFVFCTVAELPSLPLDEVDMCFREAEGITLIVRKETADRLNLPYTFVAARITLGVHSSLAAVGLTAAVATALAKEGISCNMVAAYYHDHVFVESKDLARALIVLTKLSSRTVPK